MTKISVCIITLNAARHIEKTIAAAQQVSDDVIVLDSGSTDNTQQIAKNAKARVFENEWLGYGPQKNLANSHAVNDWILSIDADEVIDQDLIEFLNQTDLKKGNIYLFKLDDHFGDRKIRFSELRPKWKKRLFNKSEVSWNDRKVHEQLVYPDSIRLIQSSGRINHYSYASLSDFEKKIDQYADLGAHEMISKNQSAGIIKRIINPNFRFVRSYLMYGGFLEGKLGYDISRILRSGLMKKYKRYNELLQQ